MGLSNHELFNRHYDDLYALTPNAAWYENAMKLPDSATARYHIGRYGRYFPYSDFREPFERMLLSWDPYDWARQFKHAGARYVILTAKHHDGYLLWPSKVRNHHRDDWHTGRDVVGDLAEAVRAHDMAFGIYYSGGLDWSFRPKPVANYGEMLASMPRSKRYRKYVRSHYYELIDRYKPDILWNGMGYPDRRGALSVLSHYYNVVPHGVVNDGWSVPGRLHDLLSGRWTRRRTEAGLKAHLMAPPSTGKWRSRRTIYEPASSLHSDFIGMEYKETLSTSDQKFEAVRKLGQSDGYNQNEPDENLVGETDLIRQFVDTVAKNGNFQVNVGPDPDGQIATEQAARLGQIGDWLRDNEEAISDTRPWAAGEGETAGGLSARFTECDGDLYILVFGCDEEGEIVLMNVPRGDGQVTLLGYGTIATERSGPHVRVMLPGGFIDRPVICLKIAGGGHQVLRNKRVGRRESSGVQETVS